MTIHLPKDVENSIEAAVHSGHFASPRRPCHDPGGTISAVNSNFARPHDAVPGMG